MLTKEKVLASIKKLPSKFSVDELIDRIILIQKIEIGLEQSRQGKVKTTKESKKQLEKWFI